MTPDKLTTAAQQVLAAAQASAMGAGHAEVGSLHVLDAMLEDQNGPARSVLDKAGVRADRVLQVAQAELKSLPTTSSAAGQTGREIMGLLQKADQHAKAMGDSYIATEHLLLACAQEGRAKSVLETVGASTKAIEQAIKDVRKASGVQNVTDQNAETTYEALKKYAVDLTEKAQQGKLDPVIGRDEEIRRTMQVLSRRTKNNPVLIGEPGVGKTAIAEGLALRIVNGDCPEASCATSGSWRWTWASCSPARSTAASSRSG